MKNHGFELPLPKPRRGNRHDAIEREEGVDVGAAVTYLEEAEAGARALTDSVRHFAAAADALLKCGLTENALVLLIQDLGPKPHGRPIPKDVISQVLKAAARVGEHLES